LHISKQCWHAKKQIRPKATSINLVCIEELNEDEAEEHHLMEAHIVQKDAREENIVV
jgi:hypothetical protein